MAIQLFKENEAFNVKSQHFLIDSTDELTNIESIYNCKQGDKAELPDGTIYVRHSDDHQGDKWVVKSASGGGSSLPDVTTNDKGKYLHTNESTGVLEWIEAAGSNGVLMVTYTVDENDSTTATCDHTFAEILSAFNGGAFVYAKMIYGYDTILLMPAHIDADEVWFERNNLEIEHDAGGNTLYGKLYSIEHYVDEDSGEYTISCVAADLFSINL